MSFYKLFSTLEGFTLVDVFLPRKTESQAVYNDKAEKWAEMFLSRDVSISLEHENGMVVTIKAIFSKIFFNVGFNDFASINAEFKTDAQLNLKLKYADNDYLIIQLPQDLLDDADTQSYMADDVHPLENYQAVFTSNLIQLIKKSPMLNEITQSFYDSFKQ